METGLPCQLKTIKDHALPGPLAPVILPGISTMKPKSCKRRVCPRPACSRQVRRTRCTPPHNPLISPALREIRISGSETHPCANFIYGWTLVWVSRPDFIQVSKYLHGNHVQCPADCRKTTSFNGNSQPLAENGSRFSLAMVFPPGQIFFGNLILYYIS